jgi:parallel beta-helix repeat protein
MRGSQVNSTLAIAAALVMTACGAEERVDAGPPVREASLARGGTTIRVPGDQASIAAAMAVAGAGDTVSLAPGTYFETLALKTGVRVVGGPSVIDAAGLDHGVTADASVTCCASAERLTVQGANGSGVWLIGASGVSVADSISRGNGNIGFYVQGGADVRLVRDTAEQNAGAGFRADLSQRTVIDAAHSLGNAFAGVRVFGGTARLERSVVTGNGGSVRLSHGAAVVAERNEVMGNGASGIRVDGGDDPADLLPARAVLEGNRVEGNQGHGIAVDDGSEADLSGNTVHANGGNGVLVAHGSTAELAANQITGNGAGVVVHAGLDLADQRRSFVRMERNVCSGGGVGLQVIASDVKSEGDAFDGNDFGVQAFFGARLQASAGRISGNATHGLWSMDVPFGLFCADPGCTAFLAPQATVHVALDGMRVEENAGIGVVAQPGGEVSIRRSSILGNHDDGLFGNSGAEGRHGAMTVRSTRIEGNAGWCAIASGDFALDLGGRSGGGNTCVGNGNGGVANTTSSQLPIPAEGNWWGTSDGAAIAALMLGPVDFVPFLPAAP